MGDEISVKTFKELITVIISVSSVFTVAFTFHWCTFLKTNYVSIDEDSDSLT